MMDWREELPLVPTDALICPQLLIPGIGVRDSRVPQRSTHFTCSQPARRVPGLRGRENRTKQTGSCSSHDIIHEFAIVQVCVRHRYDMPQHTVLY